MTKTILIGRSRKTGKDELLSGSEVSNDEQVEAYRKFKGETNEDYSEINLVRLEVWKKPLRFSTKSEVKKREEAHADALEKNRKTIEHDGHKNKLTTSQIQDNLRIANQGHYVPPTPESTPAEVKASAKDELESKTKDELLQLAQDENLEADVTSSDHKDDIVKSITRARNKKAKGL